MSGPQRPWRVETETDAGRVVLSPVGGRIQVSLRMADGSAVAFNLPNEDHVRLLSNGLLHAYDALRAEVRS